TDVKEIDASWVIRGELTVPKASSSFDGELYCIQRNGNKRISIKIIDCNEMDKSALYPYERQVFQFRLDPMQFIDYGKQQFTLDLYFRLLHYTDYQNARVRFSSQFTKGNTLKVKGTIVELYPTNFGNVSIRIYTRNIFKTLLKKVSALVIGR